MYPRDDRNAFYSNKYKRNTNNRRRETRVCNFLARLNRPSAVHNLILSVKKNKIKKSRLTKSHSDPSAHIILADTQDLIPHTWYNNNTYCVRAVSDYAAKIIIIIIVLRGNKTIRRDFASTDIIER